MSTGVTDIASKNEAIKVRKKELATAEKQLDNLVRVWAPDEAPPQQGCFPKLSLCPSLFSSAKRVATTELETNSTGYASKMRQSGQGSKLLQRVVGTRKQKSSETEKIELAMHTVQTRIVSLTDRVKIGRERAMTAKSEGRTEEAIRELKKAKAVEKQLNAARMALDTLERQQDALAESTLHRELATALKSTTEGVKAKNKGLLSMAESAVDGSTEIRDDIEDIAAVFEGMAPAYDTGADEDDLLAELDDMMSDSIPKLQDPEPQRNVSVQQETGLQPDSFPSVPGAQSASTNTTSRKQEKRALLKHDSASCSTAL